MTDKISLSPKDIEREIAGVDLGDTRLNRRFRELMLAMARSPGKSLSAMCETEAQREGAYRFVRNEHVDWRDLLKPHVEHTVQRAVEAGVVLAIHDTTTMRVHEDAGLESFINTGKRGFQAHVTLLADAMQSRRPLGIAAVRTLLRRTKKTRTKKNGRAMTGADTAKLKHKEYERWGDQIRETSALLEGGPEVVHLLDREGDSYTVLEQLVTEGESFVIRWSKDRRAATLGEGLPSWSYVSELIEDAPDTQIEREVQLSPRKAKSAPDARKSSPARSGRVARLKVAATTLVFRRPRYLDDQYLESIPVNVVYVYEPQPPSECDRVEWVLLTSLPIDNDRQVECIIDYYRQRWLIEEFFKALKSGCSYTQRPLTNPFSIFNTMACFIPIAWKALALRQAAAEPEQNATRLFDSSELQVIRIKADKMNFPLAATPTADQVLAVIASLGGHRKHRGPPGWITITRGLERFQAITEGWKLAKNAQ